MPCCNECGSWVSDNFHRVFSNEQGELWGCIDCGPNEVGGKRGFEDQPNDSTGVLL